MKQTGFLGIPPMRKENKPIVYAKQLTKEQKEGMIFIAQLKIQKENIKSQQDISSQLKNEKISKIDEQIAAINSALKQKANFEKMDQMNPKLQMEFLEQEMTKIRQEQKQKIQKEEEQKQKVQPQIKGIRIEQTKQIGEQEAVQLKTNEEKIMKDIQNNVNKDTESSLLENEVLNILSGVQQDPLFQTHGLEYTAKKEPEIKDFLFETFTYYNNKPLEFKKFQLDSSLMRSKTQENIKKLMQLQGPTGRISYGTTKNYTIYQLPASAQYLISLGLEKTLQPESQQEVAMEIRGYQKIQTLLNMFPQIEYQMITESVILNQIFRNQVEFRNNLSFSYTAEQKKINDQYDLEITKLKQQQLAQNLTQQQKEGIQLDIDIQNQSREKEKQNLDERASNFLVTSQKVADLTNVVNDRIPLKRNVSDIPADEIQDVEWQFQKTQQQIHQGLTPQDILDKQVYLRGHIISRSLGIVFNMQQYQAMAVGVYAKFQPTDIQSYFNKILAANNLFSQLNQCHENLTNCMKQGLFDLGVNQQNETFIQTLQFSIELAIQRKNIINRYLKDQISKFSEIFSKLATEPLLNYPEPTTDQIVDQYYNEVLDESEQRYEEAVKNKSQKKLKEVDVDVIIEESKEEEIVDIHYNLANPKSRGLLFQPEYQSATPFATQFPEDMQSIEGYLSIQNYINSDIKQKINGFSLMGQAVSITNLIAQQMEIVLQIQRNFNEEQLKFGKGAPIYQFSKQFYSHEQMKNFLETMKTADFNQGATGGFLKHQDIQTTMQQLIIRNIQEESRVQGKKFAVQEMFNLRNIPTIMRQTILSAEEGGVYEIVKTLAEQQKLMDSQILASAAYVMRKITEKPSAVLNELAPIALLTQTTSPLTGANSKIIISESAQKFIKAQINNNKIFLERISAENKQKVELNMNIVKLLNGQSKDIHQHFSQEQQKVENEKKQVLLNLEAIQKTRDIEVKALKQQNELINQNLLKEQNQKKMLDDQLLENQEKIQQQEKLIIQHEEEKESNKKDLLKQQQKYDQLTFEDQQKIGQIKKLEELLSKFENVAEENTRKLRQKAGEIQEQNDAKIIEIQSLKDQVRITAQNLSEKKNTEENFKKQIGELQDRIQQQTLQSQEEKQEQFNQFHRQQDEHMEKIEKMRNEMMEQNQKEQKEVSDKLLLQIKELQAKQKQFDEKNEKDIQELQKINNDKLTKLINEKTDKENQLQKAQIEIYQVKLVLQSAENDLVSTIKSSKKYENQIKLAQEKIEELNGDLEKQQNEHTKKIRELQNEVSNSRIQEQQAQVDIVNLTEQVKVHSENGKKYIEKINDLQVFGNKIKAEQEKAQIQLQQLKANENLLIKQNQISKDNISELQTESNNKEQKIAKYELENKTMKSEISTVKMQIIQLNSQIQNLTSSQEQQIQEYSQIQDQLQEAETKLQESKFNLQQSEQNLQQIKEKQIQDKEIKDKLSTTVQELQLNIQQMKVDQQSSIEQINISAFDQLSKLRFENNQKMKYLKENKNKEILQLKTNNQNEKLQIKMGFEQQIQKLSLQHDQNIEMMNDQIANLTKTNSEKERMISQLQREQNATMDKLRQAEQLVDNEETEILKSQLSQIKEQITDLDVEKVQLLTQHQLTVNSFKIENEKYISKLKQAQEVLTTQQNESNQILEQTIQKLQNEHEQKIKSLEDQNTNAQIAQKKLNQQMLLLTQEKNIVENSNQNIKQQMIDISDQLKVVSSDLENKKSQLENQTILFNQEKLANNQQIKEYEDKIKIQENQIGIFNIEDAKKLAQLKNQQQVIETEQQRQKSLIVQYQSKEQRLIEENKKLQSELDLAQLSGKSGETQLIQSKKLLNDMTLEKNKLIELNDQLQLQKANLEKNQIIQHERMQDVQDIAQQFDLTSDLKNIIEKPGEGQTGQENKPLITMEGSQQQKLQNVSNQIIAQKINENAYEMEEQKIGDKQDSDIKQIFQKDVFQNQRQDIKQVELAMQISQDQKLKNVVPQSISNIPFQLYEQNEDEQNEETIKLENSEEEDDDEKSEYFEIVEEKKGDIIQQQIPQTSSIVQQKIIDPSQAFHEQQFDLIPRDELPNADIQELRLNSLKLDNVLENMSSSGTDAIRKFDDIKNYRNVLNKVLQTSKKSQLKQKWLIMLEKMPTLQEAYNQQLPMDASSQAIEVVLYIIDQIEQKGLSLDEVIKLSPEEIRELLPAFQGKEHLIKKLKEWLTYIQSNPKLLDSQKSLMNLLKYGSAGAPQTAIGTFPSRPYYSKGIYQTPKSLMIQRDPNLMQSKHTLTDRMADPSYGQKMKTIYGNYDPNTLDWKVASRPTTFLEALAQTVKKVKFV